MRARSPVHFVAAGTCVFLMALSSCAAPAARRSAAVDPDKPHLLSTGVAPAEDARPLTDRGLDNLVAFARLVGYVRYFHPAEEAVRLNWSEFIVRGISAVEAAPTADSLAATLRALFAPIAPTVEVVREGHRARRGAAAPGRVAPETIGVVVWRHYGYADEGTDSEVYLSARVRVPAPGGKVPPRMALADYYMPSTGPDSMPVADPRVPLVVTLGGGVAASIPLAVWTVLPSVPDSLSLPQGWPAWRAFPSERAGRMADVVAYWNFAQHFYPYFDVVRTDWPAALRTGLQEAAVADSARHMRVIERLAAELHDGHAWVIDTTHISMSAGLWLAMIEGAVVITAVGDSARESGVSISDEVLTVNGRPVAEALAEEEAHTSASSPQFRRMAGLQRLLEGPQGSTLRLGVRSHGQEPRDVTVRRTGRGPAREARPAAVTELEPGVLYLDWARLSSADSGSFLPQVRAARGLVVDMRGYPSRLDAFAFLDLFSDSTLRSPPIGLPVVPLPDGAGMFFRDVSWPVKRGKWGAPAHTPVVFVTYGGAISYAETIMGVVDGYQLGPIVGEATAGSNGNNNTVRLPTGLLVGLTGLRVQKHDGSTLHGIGIIPTVSVERTLRGVREGRDEYLVRAVEALHVEIERRSTRR
jgi:hypothetical protein